MNGHKYSEQEKQWIIENYKIMQMNELAIEFEKEFGIYIEPKNLTHKIYTWDRNNHHNKIEKYSKEELDWLLENTKKHSSYITLTKEFNNYFNKNRSVSGVRRCCNVKLGIYVNSNIFTFTKKQKNWINDNLNTYKNYDELTKAFEKEFNVCVKDFTIPNYCNNRKMKISNRHTFSKEEKDFIYENFDNYTTNDLTDIFNKKFNANISRSSLGSMASNLGKKRNVYFHFTKEEDEYLIELSKQNLTFQEIYEKFNERYKRTFSSLTTRFYEFLKLKVQTNKELKYTQEHYDYIINNVKNFRKNGCFDYEGFLKAFNDKFNLGLTRKRLEGLIFRLRALPGKIDRSEWEKTINRSKYKIGDIIIRDSREWIKVNDIKCIGKTKKEGFETWKLNWMAKDRYLYEKYHNVKLTENDILLHKDCDNYNCDIDNMYIVSREEFNLMLGHQFYLIGDDEWRETAITICKIENKLKEIEVD